MRIVNVSKKPHQSFGDLFPNTFKDLLKLDWLVPSEIFEIPLHDNISVLSSALSI